MSVSSASSSTASSQITLAGTLGGIKITDIISTLDAVNRNDATRLTAQETTINSQTTALTAIQTSLNTLNDSVTTLANPAFYRTKAVAVGSSGVGTATVTDSTSAVDGTYSINVLQLATSSTYLGTKAHSLITDGTTTVLSDFGTAALGTIIVGTASGGTTAITIDSSTTLAGLATSMQTALGTGGSVSYNTTTGEFSASATDSLVLAAGTSSFLQSAQLFNNFSQRSASGTTLAATDTMSASYANFVSGTTFINGIPVTTNSTDTVQNVMDKINAQISDVTASLVNGRLTLNSSSSISLIPGTGSLFKQAGWVASSATTTTSQNAIGAIDPTAAMGTAGSLTVNGTTISYAATDSLNTVLSNITSSSAGVVAAYDSYHDRIQLSDTTSGANQISISGVTGPLLNYGLVDSGTGLEAGTFSAGNQAIVSLNGGANITAASNTISGSTLGIGGVTFTATGVGTTTLTISPDVTTIQTAIDAFLTKYNASQTLMASYTAVNSTDPTQDGALANDPSVSQLPQQLRLILGSRLYKTGTYQTLADLGITGNSTDNTVTSSNTGKLTAALASHMNDVLNIFANPLSGLYSLMSGRLIATAAGGASTLGTEEASNKKQITLMDQQIIQVNQRADLQKTQLQNEFGAYQAAFNSASSVSSIFGNSSNSSSSTAGGIL